MATPRSQTAIDKRRTIPVHPAVSEASRCKWQSTSGGVTSVASASTTVAPSAAIDSPIRVQRPSSERSTDAAVSAM